MGIVLYDNSAPMFGLIEHKIDLFEILELIAKDLHFVTLKYSHYE